MYQRILVPFDGSPTSDRGLEEATKLAQLTQATIRLLHVIDQMAFVNLLDAYASYVGDWMTVLEREAEKMLQTAKEKITQTGVPAESVLYNGLQRHLSDFVEDEVRVWRADLIVMGTHGRRGINRILLGSDAERLLRRASIPVLLVRLPESEVTVSTASAAETLHVRLPSAALSFER